MIEALLILLACIGIMQLLGILALVVALHRDTAAVENLHTTVDDVQTGLVAERNQNARWQS